MLFPGFVICCGLETGLCIGKPVTAEALPPHGERERRKRLLASARRVPERLRGASAEIGRSVHLVRGFQRFIADLRVIRSRQPRQKNRGRVEMPVRTPTHCPFCTILAMGGNWHLPTIHVGRATACWGLAFVSLSLCRLAQRAGSCAGSPRPDLNRPSMAHTAECHPTGTTAA